MNLIQIVAPPLPMYIAGGKETYRIGEEHPNRYNITVFDLIIVTKGCLYMIEGEEKFTVEEKNALILGPDQHHYPFAPCDKMTQFYWFHFTTSCDWTYAPGILSTQLTKQQLPSFGRKTINPYKEKKFTLLIPKICLIKSWETVTSLCEKLLYFDGDMRFSWEWEKQMLFLQLLHEVANSKIIEHSFRSVIIAEKAATYLRNHMKEKITYKDLGKALNFHPNHISRCMIEHLGCTPTEYLYQLRIEKAKIQLITTDQSIEQIAEKCGFNQVSYFSKKFKLKEGISPNEYRRQFSKHRLI